MVVLIAFTVFALYLFYLYAWSQRRLSREYCLANPSPSKPLPHSPALSILFGILWGLTVVGGVFWGFYGNPYSNLLAWHSAMSNLDIFLVIAIVVAVGLSYLVAYRVGEIKGVTSMKTPAVFRQSL
jgi:uncharacterized membrane protein YfcA